MTTNTNQLVRAARLADVQRAGCLPVQVNGHTLALFAQDGRVFAVDNRCPHMGFPLHRGTVRDGILTCHWHHARFDLASGGTFDQWADDVAAFPVELRDGEVWVDLAPHAGRQTHLRQRLNDGLERNIPLVMAKAIIGLLDGGSELAEPFRLGLDFGVRYRRNGWGQGLTILTCMVNLLPYLQTDDRPRALYHGLSAVANDSDGAPPRFMVNPLPSTPSDPAVLKRWFRQFIEVRDDEGAERCIISAIRAGADNERMADMLFAAATDHRYIQIGHPLDFTNKAFEALDAAGWSHAERVLTSLVTGYAMASRMEESNAWRYPIDLIAILDTTFEQLPAVLAGSRWPVAGGKWQVVESGRPSAVGRPSTDLVAVLLGEDPQAIADALLAALREGVSPVELAGVVAYTAALRIARFHTSNEFSDWDTALHTFTFANAVHRGLRRTPSAELVRGIFDAAMSVYLDRFLNVPAARLPEPDGSADPDELLAALPALFDRQQQVNEAGESVAAYLAAGGPPGRLLALLGRLLLREDRDFHTIQTVEAAVRQYHLLKGTPEASHVLVAAARYLAAHAPTMRAQGQTYQIAYRLSRGERLFEE